MLAASLVFKKMKYCRLRDALGFSRGQFYPSCCVELGWNSSSCSARLRAEIHKYVGLTLFISIACQSVKRLSSRWSPF